MGKATTRKAAASPRAVRRPQAALKSRPAARRKKARRKARPTAGWALRLARLWPVWLGVAFVVAAGWLLWRWVATTGDDADQSAPPTYTVRGIDVSHHQGTIDWELLRNQGAIDGQPLCFAFIKATEGTEMVDPQFARNFRAARHHGIMRGAYHFYRATLPAKQQAEHFIRHVSLDEGDLPPVLDVEVKPADVSDEDFRQGILEWLLRVEQHYRVKPILYTYHSFRQQYMRDSIFNLYPYWIAHYYVDSVRYRGAWAFWQHSDSGRLPGIRERVDLNLFNGTYDELRALALPAR